MRTFKNISEESQPMEPSLPDWWLVAVGGTVGLLEDAPNTAGALDYYTNNPAFEEVPTS